MTRQLLEFASQTRTFGRMHLCTSDWPSKASRNIKLYQRYEEEELEHSEQIMIVDEGKVQQDMRIHKNEK